MLEGWLGVDDDGVDDGDDGLSEVVLVVVLVELVSKGGDVSTAVP